MWRAHADRFLIAAVAAGLLGAGCGGEMKETELENSIRTIETSAAEGSLLASHAYTDKTKTTFVRVRARELGEALDHEQEKLNDADPENGDVAADKQRAIQIAAQASEHLGQLETAPQNKPEAGEIGKRLQELADAAESLRGHL